MWLKILVFSYLAHGDIKSQSYNLALRNQIRCELGCQNISYDSGFWSPAKKLCVCIDEFKLSDLFLKTFTVPRLPKAE